MPFIIDIDVFQDARRKPTDSLVEQFNNLRVLKNNIFEDLVTADCKQFFK